MVNNPKSNWFEYSIASKEDIYRLYWDEGLSTCNIADIYDTSTNKVYNIMVKCKIPRRTHSESSKGNTNRLGSKMTDYTRKRLSESNLGRKFSLEHRKKLSLIKKLNPPKNLVKKGQIGENHIKWIEDRSKLKSNERITISTSYKYKQWRNKVYERDNYTCQKCGDNKGGNLEAHHIKPFALYPKRIYDVDNGLTLCKNCHCELHKLNPIQYKVNNGLYKTR